MRAIKTKTRNIAILFFSLILTLAVFSQLEVSASAGKTQTTSDVVWVNPSDYFYSKTSNDNLSAYLGKKGSNVPTVRYQKDKYFLEFSMNKISSTTAVSLETNSKEPNTPTLFYRNIAENIDAAYKITNLPFRVKEEIVLRKNPPLTTKRHPMSFGGGELTFLFNSKTNPVPVKQPDGSIYFYDNQNNYLFQIDKPFMIDGKGTVSNDAGIEIVPVKSPSSSSSYKVKNNFQFLTRLPDGQVSNFQSIFNNPIFKQITSSFSSLKIKPQTTSDVVWGQHTITLSASSDWLNDPSRVYPVVIDPTITPNADANFSGEKNRIADADSTSSTQLESSYPEAALDPYTVLLLHFNEANGATSGIKDYASTTRVITANDNASTTSYVTQLGLGNSAAFDGTSDYFEIADSEDWDFTSTSTDMTISLWIYPNDILNTRLIGQSNAGADGNWSLGISQSDNDGDIYLGTAGGPVLSSGNSAIVAGKWYHIAIAKRNGFTEMYKNGLLVSSGSAAYFNNATTFLRIGARAAADGDFNGYLDEIRIIKGRALTIDEIKAAASRRPYAVYTSPVLDATASASWNTLNWTEGGVKTGDGETLYNSNSLVAQWNFHETSDTTAANNAGSCGASCNGTLTNFSYTAPQDQATTTTGWTANNKKWGAGALMFDGTNDYVSVGDNAAWDFGAGNFTIDLWVMVSNLGASQLPLINRAKGASGDWYTIYMTNAGNINVYINDVQVIANAKWNPVFGAWYYLVLVREGTGTDQVKVYVNGVLVASGTSSANISDTEALYIATHKNLGSFFSGIIDSTRIYSRALSASEILSNYNAGNIEIQTRTGATSDPNDGTWEAWKPTTGETQLLSMDSDAANWHSDIMASTTIATSTDTVIKAEGTGSLKVKMGMASTTAGTVALWHFEETGTTTGTYLYDETANNNDATTTGTTVVDGIFGKARKFNGTSDYLSVADSANWNFGGGDFSVDFWVNFSSLAGRQALALQHDDTSNKWVIDLWGTGYGSKEIEIYSVAAGSTRVYAYTSPTNIIAGVWYHIAIIREGITPKIYLNGVSQSMTITDSFATMPDLTAPLDFGKWVTGDPLKGSLDEFRILKGRAVSPDEIAETYRMGANHHLTRQISAADLSSATKLPFYIAADRPGTYLEAMVGESDYANYELASSTLALSTTTVLYIKGDEIAPSTSIKDSSFSGKTITANGNARTAGGGKIGNAMSFDGTSNYFELADNDDWDFTAGNAKGSIDFWFYANDLLNSRLVGQNNSGADGNWSIYINSSDNDGDLGLSIAGGAVLGSATGIIKIGKWYHVAGVKDGSTTTIYLNSAPLASGTGTYWNNATTFLRIAGRAVAEADFNGLLDELRIIKGTALTADQIRQAYEYGLLCYTLCFDFGATLQTSDLISSATDYNFSLTATTSGLSATTSGLYLGDKIIIKENLGGTEYSAQGTVNAINTTTAAITVPSWDSGSTFPSGNGYSPAATVFKWQREYFDLTGALSTHRNAITNLTLRPTNGAGGRTVYLDDFRYNTNYLT